MPALVIGPVVTRVAIRCAVGAAGLVAVSTMATPATVQSPADGADASPADTPAAREADRVAARVARLVEEHGCWTDAAPPGVPAPRHAVVTRPGERPRLVPAEVGYRVWLEDEPGALHGFCP